VQHYFCFQVSLILCLQANSLN